VNNVDLGFFYFLKELLPSIFMHFSDFQLPPSLADVMGGRVAFALQLATAASRETLKYFRTSAYQVERKSDRSPVTLADKQAEQLVRHMIAAQYPGDAVLGEEFGSVPGQSEFEWIIDPIDGTKSFISGVPLYSTLIGMTQNGQPSIGVIAIPAMNEVVVAAHGLGAWYGQSDPGASSSWPLPLHRTSVSRQSNLADGLFVVSQADNFAHRNAMAAYHELEREAYVTRSWGDGYGYLLVATGRAEVMVDPIVNPWDVAAVAPVIVEAGGKFSSWSGTFDIRAGHCIGSNGLVHARVLDCLRGYA
jgi:histidinol phosphatase-like enzyme (inositol monophosphatase family)